MKSILCKLTLAAMAFAGTCAFAPKADAAKIRLEGFGFYEVANRVKYHTKSRAPRQTGRPTYNLGKGYYHRAEIGMDYLVNYSGVRSGDLSFEFWAMPYFGADQGVVLMKRGRGPIGAGREISNIRGRGWALDLDRRRFPELNIWELTRKGWTFRDALSFDYRDWL